MTDKPTDAPPVHRVTAFDLVSREPWAITPDMLNTIAAIARREHEGPEAVEARQGRPLQNSRTVTQRGNVAYPPIRDQLDALWKGGRCYRNGGTSSCG